MSDPVVFWLGFLGCALVARVGESLNDRIERSECVKCPECGYVAGLDELFE